MRSRSWIVGGGLFDPGTVVLFVSFPQQGTGAIQYVPSGLFEGNLMYVNWDFGEVCVFVRPIFRVSDTH